MSNQLSKVWIISDTHFNHSMLVEKGLRKPGYEHNIIHNWKTQVKENDIVIHLGDVIFSRASSLNDILQGLPGYKILVRGNHDKNTPYWYMTHGFDEVHDEYNIVSNDGKVINCTHIPSETKADINLCGHLHNYKDRKAFTRHKQSMHISKKTRVYSPEIEKYTLRNLEYIIKDTDTSACFFRAVGFKKIRFILKLVAIKNAIVKVGNIKIF